ncbi:MAG: hypothetical protein K2M34_00405 [Alphaproteobacteria bacterium]|nr:hypothetical protein [Alphaproteobacteria bacterium]
MKVINMTYNPITGVQYNAVEIPDVEIKSNYDATAAAAAYQQTQQVRAKRTARIRKNNTKHK